jgi:sulfate/thiosulfate transport system substrate-binding protein
MLIVCVVVVANCRAQRGSKDVVSLLHVSYDPTRELYTEYNTLFARFWFNKTGQRVEIRQSHGGSSKQARSVLEGLQADVVSLALAYDIDMLARKADLLPTHWQTRLPHNSAPYTSTIVFVVRRGNPKNIRDWNDLIKPDVAVITPNPKTSGVARWNYLAAWLYGAQNSTQPTAAKSFVTELYKHVPVLDSGSRGATTSFAERQLGDVLITWENEASLLQHEFVNKQFEVIMPSISVFTEPPVAVVDKNVNRHNTRAVAEAYVQYLYSEEAQEIIAKHGFRPVSSAAQARHPFPEIKRMGIDSFMGGWDEVQHTHFDDGGIFDQIYLGQP